MRINMLIYLVWIIMFNSWYKHGMGKKRFKNVEFSLWITLKHKWAIKSHWNCGCHYLYMPIISSQTLTWWSSHPEVGSVGWAACSPWRIPSRLVVLDHWVWPPEELVWPPEDFGVLGAALGQSAWQGDWGLDQVKPGEKDDLHVFIMINLKSSMLKNTVQRVGLLRAGLQPKILQSQRKC